mmetsp:Transcript_16640/g.23272  ORF Transcript_16640/g.23272 Transcript_16640/m.23272 type:complete len:428 (-) Transcript_16640:302-1585(-)|eukprot:CAMPEP_0184480548 /NCGR_PEP_ID=MMETSP0113_2-20130426/2044_1 /TAXON_ID=91329 /ORGANISM="Norrisiella sphaerica, Strain BC52" /LENGTH=427 /DNA_ID=CAMNT_0026859093 /DNA_START=192 /DNA_END=1475 /DNA_ORIENTATION=-
MNRLGRITGHLNITPTLDSKISAAKKEHKIGILTAGGLAPCLSSAVGGLIERYTEIDPAIEIICYRYGYQGLLVGDSFKVNWEMRRNAHLLQNYGGSPIGNSRVKLKNVKDCVKRKLVRPGQLPQDVACNRLVKDGITILHTIGGDDTNTTAARLAARLKERGIKLQVLGLPKTVDNDVYPVQQSLGADTAALQGAMFFESIVNEATANPRMLIVHEVMGRHCGWLTVATAEAYRKRLKKADMLDEMGVTAIKRDVHGVYIPEMPINLEGEGARLRAVMDEIGNVNVFISEGAASDLIVKEKEAKGEKLPRDAFGHVKLDKVNAGQWIADHLKPLIGARKVLVQKSGYRARSSPANTFDRNLIKSCVTYAVEAAFRGESGLVGHDDQDGKLKALAFTRVKGGKPFDTGSREFRRMMFEIGQPVPRTW